MKILPENGKIIMLSLPNQSLDVKENALAPGEEDRATVGTDLSASSGPSGVSSFSSPLQPQMGLKAINPPATELVSPKTAIDNGLRPQLDNPSPASVGLSLIPVNSNLWEIIEKYRVHRYKIDHAPVKILRLRHKSEGSEALYRVSGISTSRYFPEGRDAIRRTIIQRLGVERQRGVFLTLTTSAGDYDLVDSWPMIWPNFNRYKASLNKYRKRYMGPVGASGISQL